jgi:hypothetical protein
VQPYPLVFDTSAVRDIGDFEDAKWKSFQARWLRGKFDSSWIPIVVSEVLGTNLMGAKERGDPCVSGIAARMEKASSARASIMFGSLTIPKGFVESITQEGCAPGAMLVDHGIVGAPGQAAESRTRMASPHCRIRVTGFPLKRYIWPPSGGARQRRGASEGVHPVVLPVQ